MNLTEKEILRYSRQIQLRDFGMEGQLKLKHAKVLVVGAGGLGCIVLQYLGAAGIGTIGIMDPERVESSNLHRQVLYGEHDIGDFKVHVAARKLQEQNSSIQLHSYFEKLNPENVEQIFQSYEIIVDCTDNFSARYLINDACFILGKIMVYGAIHGFEGQVSVFHIAVNKEKAVTYRCLFPESPEAGSIPSCEEAGVIGVLPGITGLLQATEVIKIITGIGDVLSGKLLLYDVLKWNFSIQEFDRNPNVESITPKSFMELKRTNYNFSCEENNSSNEITAAGLQKLLDENQDIQFLDVRREEEWPVVEELSGLVIPLDKIENGITEISREKRVVVFCKSGNRSAKAHEILRNKYHFGNIFNLKGGVDEWLRFKKIK